MPNKKKITVVLATYNGSKYIDEQINSIVTQDRLPNELIIVDDCSVDETPAILSQYRKKYDFIKLLKSKKNHGVVKAFELGLHNATGDIVFLSDQDDVWFPNKISSFLAKFEDNRIVCVLGNLRVLYDDGSPAHDFFSENPSYRFSIFKQLQKNDFIGCNLAIKKSVLNLALPFPASIPMHDWWLGVVSLSFGSVAYLDVITMNYRRHSFTVTSFKRRPMLHIIISRIKCILALFCLLARISAKNIR